MVNRLSCCVLVLATALPGLAARAQLVSVQKIKDPASRILQKQYIQGLLLGSVKE